VEEAGAGDPVDEEIFALAPGGVVDGSDCGLFVQGLIAGLIGTGGEVGVGGGEGGEVVGSEDVGGGPFKGGDVEGEVVAPEVGGEHGRADGGRRDAVLVGLAPSAVAGVEACGRDLG